MKFLVDECLDPALAQFVCETYDHYATSVRDVGLCGEKDWKIVPYVIANDFVLITHNSKDFRGKGGNPGFLTSKHLHPGLICLNSANSMTPGLQRTAASSVQLFGKARYRRHA